MFGYMRKHGDAPLSCLSENSRAAENMKKRYGGNGISLRYRHRPGKAMSLRIAIKGKNISVRGNP